MSNPQEVPSENMWMTRAGNPYNVLTNRDDSNDASRPCEVLFSNYSLLPISGDISNKDEIMNLLVNECDYTTNPPVKSLKCWYTNADSLTNKLVELQCRIKVTSPDILCVTEVDPKNSAYDVSPALLQIDGYDCFVSSFSRGSRGVCIYVKSSLYASLLNMPDFNFSESLWCSVMVCSSDSLIVGVIYHSPSSSPENNFNMLRLLAEVQKL